MVWVDTWRRRWRRRAASFLYEYSAHALACRARFVLHWARMWGGTLQDVVVAIGWRDVREGRMRSVGGHISELHGAEATTRAVDMA